MNDIQEIKRIIALPAKTSLSERLFSPKSSTVDAPNSIKYPIAVILNIIE